jgi:hypothetical protein
MMVRLGSENAGGQQKMDEKETRDITHKQEK